MFGLKEVQKRYPNKKESDLKNVYFVLFIYSETYLEKYTLLYPE